MKTALPGCKPTAAIVSIDGTEFKFKKVWLVATMYGTHCNGGMIPAMQQNREDGALSVTVIHDCGKLRLRTMLPSLFKGNGEKYRKYISVYSGRDIIVAFDESSDLVVDGERYTDVLTYGVNAYGIQT